MAETQRPQPRPAVLNMAPYSPPTAGRADKLRLDFNENTVGCSPRVLALLRERIDANQLAVYPEYCEAKGAVAAFFGVPAENLLFTNGTDEAIQVLVNTYVDDGGEVLLLGPSYAMYRFYAELAGAAVREIGYRAADLAFPKSCWRRRVRRRAPSSSPIPTTPRARPFRSRTSSGFWTARLRPRS